MSDEIKLENGTTIKLTNDKEIFIGGGRQGGKTFKSKQELLKSLGLYWRTWPENIPEDREKVLLKSYINEVYTLWFSVVHISQWSSNEKLMEVRDGDEWLPLEALKVLP